MLSPAGGKRRLPDPIKGRIAVVGPCASGKSALVDNLRACGYDARQCAQEHSHVAEMWQRLTRPEVLVYLDVSLAVAARRHRADYGADYFRKQRQRLLHARRHADIYLHTDALSEDKVFARVVTALATLGVEPMERGPERE